MFNHFHHRICSPGGLLNKQFQLNRYVFVFCIFFEIVYTNALREQLIILFCFFILFVLNFLNTLANCMLPCHYRYCWQMSIRIYFFCTILINLIYNFINSYSTIRINWFFCIVLYVYIHVKYFMLYNILLKVFLNKYSRHIIYFFKIINEKVITYDYIFLIFFKIKLLIIYVLSFWKTIIYYNFTFWKIIVCLK